MGLAKPMEQVKGTLCATLWYMAHKVFNNKAYTVQADMLSFGIITQELGTNDECMKLSHLDSKIA